MITFYSQWIYIYFNYLTTVVHPNRYLIATSILTLWFILFVNWFIFFVNFGLCISNLWFVIDNVCLSISLNDHDICNFWFLKFSKCCLLDGFSFNICRFFMIEGFTISSGHAGHWKIFEFWGLYVLFISRNFKRQFMIYCIDFCAPFKF